MQFLAKSTGFRDRVMRVEVRLILSGNRCYENSLDYHSPHGQLRFFPSFTNERKVSMVSLAGKVAVISGGTTGIGLAIAQRYVAEGAHVFIFGRRQAQLDAATQRIGRNVTAIQADATDLRDLERVASAVSAEKGFVDIVVSNAALVEQASIDTLTPEHFDKTFNLNARSPVFLVQTLLPLMTKGGSIILVSSAMHVMGIPGHTTYAATKAALRSYARTWAAEFKNRGIRVNTLSPGVTDTPMLDSQVTNAEQRQSLVDMYLKMIPIGRLAQPEEIANAAVFLASGQSAYVTGADLMCDGGIGQV
ncbi:SDR family oxidoreductase [Trinickia sp. Y13]|uniref:SDR family NAD(P)-dependent oxidoreductase n=1 Tax=Trinickia sp. Y13 TaxID=2917807 RepID=UPI0024071B5E|nr:SDR family oxidoreductase [Trinickia sp. Y13]MDG0024573.1 SDR family oxidoreductase [Trinickia sp. Y13]